MQYDLEQSNLQCLKPLQEELNESSLYHDNVVINQETTFDETKSMREEQKFQEEVEQPKLELEIQSQSELQQNQYREDVLMKPELEQKKW